MAPAYFLVSLLCGDSLLSLSSDKPFLDIIDEWSDITEMPFVHTLCVMRDESFSKELSLLLADSQQAGRLSIDEISNQLSLKHNIISDTMKPFLSHFMYGFDEQSKESLEEFFRMAFYQGLLGDIPEMKFGM